MINFASLRKALAFMLPYKRAIWLGVFFLVVTNAAQLAIPWYIRAAIDGIETPEADAILQTSVLIIAAAAILQAVVRVASRWVLFGVGRSVEYDVRQRMFQFLLRQDPSFYEESSVGDLISRASNDLNSVRLLFGFGILNLTNTAFAYVATLSMMLVLSPKLTLFALAPMPLMFIVLQKFGGALHEGFVELQAQMGNLSTFLQESIQGMDVIQAYNQETGFRQAFDKQNQANYDASLRLAHIRGLMTPVMVFVAGVGSFVVLYFGGRAVIDGEITLGTFVAFQGYLAMLVWPTLALGYLFNVIQRGMASFDRVEHLLQDVASGANTQLGEGETLAKDGETFDVVVSGLEVVRVDRSGNRQPFHLGPIELDASTGKWIGVAGDTGCGKSTLLRAMAQYVAATAGQINYGQYDAAALSQDELFSLVGYVPQKPILFGLTIRENLAFREDHALDGELWQMLEAVELADEVRAIDGQLDAKLGESGITLSGGQRQRLALARVMLRKPPIILLDDALSAVDSEKEALILDAMQRLLSDTTLIVAAHRTSVLSRCDTLVVMKAGQIVERGHHDQLIDSDGVYARLHQRQQLQAELAQQEDTT